MVLSTWAPSRPSKWARLASGVRQCRSDCRPRMWSSVGMVGSNAAQADYGCVQCGIFFGKADAAIAEWSGGGTQTAEWWRGHGCGSILRAQWPSSPSMSCLASRTWKNPTFCGGPSPDGRLLNQPANGPALLGTWPRVHSGGVGLQWWEGTASSAACKGAPVEKTSYW